MKRLAPLALGALFVVLAAAAPALSHCEVPCGIYGDKMRIDMLYEDAATIEKAMRQVADLASMTDAHSANQRVRWITNKEEHATRFQDTVWQYFMTQRIKPADKTDEAARAKYLNQITTLHAMLRQAMKCKQTVDPAEVEELRKLIDRFASLYFDDEALEHIREEHGEHGDG